MKNLDWIELSRGRLDSAKGKEVGLQGGRFGRQKKKKDVRV